MADIVDMKQRVAATEAKLKAANAEGEKRSRRLLELLDSVEQNFSLNQREILALREEQAAAAEEIQQLRNLLQVMLTLAETSKASRPSLPHSELENLIKRLNQMVAAADPSPDEAACETEHRLPERADAVEQSEPPGDKDQSHQRKKSRGKKLSKILTFLAALGWIAATGLIAERSHGVLMAAAVEADLARSHSAAHALS
jgi:hypothetical protein